MRTITVVGEGTVNQNPDTIILNVELVSLNLDYEEAVKEASKKLNLLYMHLGSLGFEKNDIKTSSFNINPRYENVRDEFGNYKNEFAGYEVRQNLRIEFPMDTNCLGEVLNAITRSITKPNINIQFTIKDQDSLTQAALKKATQNAFNIANTLAFASGVKIEGVQEIEHLSRDAQIYSTTRLAPTLMYSKENIDIVPENIEVTEKVKITFSLMEDNH